MDLLPGPRSRNRVEMLCPTPPPPCSYSPYFALRPPTSFPGLCINQHRVKEAQALTGVQNGSYECDEIVSSTVVFGWLGHGVVCSVPAQHSTGSPTC